MSLQNRIRFMRQGMDVRRYHQYHTAEKDSVGKHSAGVALFVMLLQPEGTLPRAELLAAALAHDLPEGSTGDIPAPAKRAMGAQARLELQNLEDLLLSENGLLFDLTPQEERQLKLADYLDGLSFCTEELRRGNRTLKPVGETYLKYLGQIDKNDREHQVLGAVHELWKGVQ